MGFQHWDGARSLGGGLAWLLGLGCLACPLNPGWGQDRDGLEDFGRWQTRPSHCLLVRTTTRPFSRLDRRCRNVRLDQQLPGLLSLRLGEAGSDSLLPGQMLTLAGVLKPGSRAMSCQDGRCTPPWPLILQVSAVAERGFNAQPTMDQQIQGQLPQAQLAEGECRLNATGARCLVKANKDLAWQVEITW